MLNTNPRLKVMIDKLYDQVQRDCIGDEWSEKFILDMRERAKQNFTLTEKHIAKLEELFEQYQRRIEMGYCVKHDQIYSDEDFCPDCDAGKPSILVQRVIKETSIKYNQGKLRIRLCPPFLRNMMISALEYGCKKYFENSWRKGFMVADMYDAANRHMDSFFHDREDIDEESGCHHLDCAIFSVAMMRYSVDIEGMDNRPPVTPDQIAEVIRLGMIEVQKRKGETTNGIRY